MGIAAMGSIVMSDQGPPGFENDFEARLKQAREDERARSWQGRGNRRAGIGLGLGMRIATEIVVALAVGAGIGYFLDKWLGTTPWLMIVFFFLGAAAGILNVVRVASGYDYRAGYQKHDGAGDGPDDQGKA